MHLYIRKTEGSVQKIIGALEQENELFEVASKEYSAASRSASRWPKDAFSARFKKAALRVDSMGGESPSATGALAVVQWHFVRESSYGTLNALSGTLLQIARQGISSIHGEPPVNCPDGRTIGTQALRDVIWHGRNHAMHFEHPPRKTTRPSLVKLERDFPVRFSGITSDRRNHAWQIVKLLEWTSYAVYSSDMMSLLPTVPAG